MIIIMSNRLKRVAMEDTSSCTFKHASTLALIEKMTFSCDSEPQYCSLPLIHIAGDQSIQHLIPLCSAMHATRSALGMCKLCTLYPRGRPCQLQTVSNTWLTQPVLGALHT